MPKKKRESAIYQRGRYWLDWDRKRDGSLRSPFLAIFWHDAGRGGWRSKSTGTASIEDGKTALDAFFLEAETGQAHCKACGQPLGARQRGGYDVSDAIADYLIGHARRLDSYDAIRARLDHVLDYVETLPTHPTTCEAIDEPWIARFREWAELQPIIAPKGGERKRSPATIEGSVAQLSAAINFSYRRGDASGPARFKSLPLRGLNQTPQHRSQIREIAAMFRYCVDPDVSAELEAEHWGRRAEPFSKAEIIEIRRRERSALHRFLMISIATICRPDAAMDFSLDPELRQWIPQARIINLNPKGRRQTKKYRATIPAARQLVPILDDADPSFFVGPKSIRKAWAGMAASIGLPGEREAGEKLIRRSMGDLVRRRLAESHGPESVIELSMFMGHDKTDPITSLYAPFSPDYLRRALAAIEAIIDEIERLAPGAFSRTKAGAADNVVRIGKGKNA